MCLGRFAPVSLADAAVEQFPDGVGVTGVPGGLVGEMQEDPAQVGTGFGPARAVQPAGPDDRIWIGTR